MAYTLSIGSLQTPSYSGGGTALITDTLLFCFFKEKKSTDLKSKGFLVLFTLFHLSEYVRGPLKTDTAIALRLSHKCFLHLYSFLFLLLLYL